MRSSVDEWSWISPSPNSMVEPVSLKSNRVATSRWAWSTAFRTSWRSTSETTSKVGTSQTLSFLFAVLGRCPSGQRELTVNQPAQPTEVRILPGPPGTKAQVRGYAPAGAVVQEMTRCLGCGHELVTRTMEVGS